MTSEPTRMFTANKVEQYRAINDLIDESRQNGIYYTLLILSSIIISAGLLLGNSSILIGGMLITPVLTPVLLVALGVTTSNEVLLKRTAITILKSVGVIVGISALAGILFNYSDNQAASTTALFENSLRAAFLYFLVALASGVAGTLAWVHQRVNNILPGISIAVSLVPPISMVGIAFVAGQSALAQYFLVVFLFNLFGIIMGGIVIFSMLEFYRSEKTVSQKVDEIIEAEKDLQKSTESEV